MASRDKKRPATTDEYDSDGGFVVDDNEQKQGKSAKKTKPSGGLQSSRAVDDNGDFYWEISNQRRVTISSFKGKTLVGMREYYEKDGKALPGKKGISLSMDQFRSLLLLLPDIEETLLEKDEYVPRPRYTKKNDRDSDHAIENAASLSNSESDNSD